MAATQRAVAAGVHRHVEIPAERLELVEDVWDSIVAEGEGLPVPESHRQELARRRQDHRDHPEDVVPWEEVRAQLWSEE